MKNFLISNNFKAIYKKIVKKNSLGLQYHLFCHLEILRHKKGNQKWEVNLEYLWGKYPNYGGTP